MKLTLYQDPLCPFCMRVKSFLSLRNIDLPMRNTMTDVVAYKELLAGGGRATVPCLRIEREDGNVEWMYESIDIMQYIDQVSEQLN